MGNETKSSHYSVSLHRGGLKQGPGHADGHQEEGHDQQSQGHHDLRHHRAARLAHCFLRSMFPAVRKMRQWPKETAKEQSWKKLFSYTAKAWASVKCIHDGKQCVWFTQADRS